MSDNTNITRLTADYGKGNVFFAERYFPIGSFAVDAMNIDTSVVDEMIKVSEPIAEIYNEIQNDVLDLEKLRNAAPNILSVVRLASQIKPFSMLDTDFMITHAEKYGTDKFYENYTITKSELDNPESMFIYPTWYQLKQLYYEEIIWYATIANDLCVCRNVFIDFYNRKLSCLDKYDKAELIRAWNDDHICGIGLFVRQLRSSGLGLAPDVMRDTSLGFFPTVSVEMTYNTKPTTDGKVEMVRSYTFERLSHFLTVDFFEGLMAGHYPRKCEMCGGYFLMESAKNQKYCNGYFPGDEKNRTCRAVAARTRDKEKELAEDHPIIKIYKTRCNTVDHHVSRGKITERKAETVKKLARDKKYRAIRDNEYFLNDYEKEMSQEVIYAEADALMAE